MPAVTAHVHVRFTTWFRPVLVGGARKAAFVATTVAAVVVAPAALIIVPVAPARPTAEEVALALVTLARLIIIASVARRRQPAPGLWIAAFQGARQLPSVGQGDPCKQKKPLHAATGQRARAHGAADVRGRRRGASQSEGWLKAGTKSRQALAEGADAANACGVMQAPRTVP